MCGIVGYTGRDQAVGYLLEGLRTLEYRGYDSAGVEVLGERMALANFFSFPIINFVVFVVSKID